MMRSVQMVSLALALGASCGWACPTFAQTAPSTGGINIPGVKVPNIPGIPQIPGVQQGTPGSRPASGGAAATAASMPKGQDAQWANQRCLNRGDNNLGTCQDVCRNLGVTRASDASEYSGICNY
jgi:hypothetical protein